MGAVKDLAIQLEINADQVIGMDADRAYRYGLLEALRLITETAQYMDADTPAWKVHQDCWRNVHDAVVYLRTVSELKHQHR